MKHTPFALYIILGLLIMAPEAMALGVYDSAVNQYRENEKTAVMNYEAYQICEQQCEEQQTAYIQSTKEYLLATTDVLHYQLHRLREYITSRAEEDAQAAFALQIAELDSQIMQTQWRIAQVATESELAEQETIVQEHWEQTEALSTTVVGKLSNDKIAQSIRFLHVAHDRLRDRSALLAFQGTNTSSLNNAITQFGQELTTLQRMQTQAELQYEKTDELEIDDAEDLTIIVLETRAQLERTVDTLATAVQELRK